MADRHQSLDFGQEVEGNTEALEIEWNQETFINRSRDEWLNRSRDEWQNAENVDQKVLFLAESAVANWSTLHHLSPEKDAMLGPVPE